MSDYSIGSMKRAILEHVQTVFDELEQALVLQHQEKYSLLEDALDNADDMGELKIAFEHWHVEHAEDLDLDDDPEDMWISVLEMVEEDEEDEEDYDDDEDEDEVDPFDEEEEFED